VNTQILFQLDDDRHKAFSIFLRHDSRICTAWIITALATPSLLSCSMKGSNLHYWHKIPPQRMRLYIWESNRRQPKPLFRIRLSFRNPAAIRIKTPPTSSPYHVGKRKARKASMRGRHSPLMRVQCIAGDGPSEGNDRPRGGLIIGSLRNWYTCAWIVNHGFDSRPRFQRIKEKSTDVECKR